MVVEHPLVSVDVSAVPANMTGVGRYAVGVLSEIGAPAAEAGLEIAAVTKLGDGSRFSRYAPGIRMLETVPTSRLRRLVYEQRSMGAVLDELGVVLHHGIHYTLPGRMKAKKVVTIHDATLIEHPEWHERSKVAFFSRMIARSAKEADALVFPSQSALQGFARHFETNARTAVIPHGVNDARFDPPEGVGDEEQLNELGVEGPYLLFCGTLEPRKNLERLLDAHMRAWTDGPRLVVAGLAGWKDSRLRQKLDYLVESRAGKVLGFVSDAQLGALYRNALATLYPSLEEGFGLPGLEAMSQGSLLVTSLGSAMQEYAEGVALFVDPLDVASLAAAIERAIAGGSDLEAMAAAGRERAMAMTWASSAKSHLALYRSILGL